jgi:hypothetical protein
VRGFARAGCADQAKPLREVTAIGMRRPRLHGFLKGLADDNRRLDAFFSGFGLQLLLEPFIDPDIEFVPYFPHSVTMSDRPQRVADKR